MNSAGSESSDRERVLLSIHKVIGTVLPTMTMDVILDNVSQALLQAGIFRSLMIAIVDHPNNCVEIATSIVAYERIDGKRVRAIRIDTDDIAVEKNVDLIGITYSLDDDNITARVARTGEMAVVNEFDEAILDARVDSDSNWSLGVPGSGKVAYFIPLVYVDEVIAVVATGSLPEEQPEILARLEMIQPLLDLVAASLHHARQARELVNKQAALETAVQSLHNLHEISRLTIRVLDSEQILNTLGRQVVATGVLRSLMVSLVDHRAQRVFVLRDFNGRLAADGRICIDEGKTGDSFHLDGPDILAETARTGKHQIALAWDERFTVSTQESRRGQLAYFIPLQVHGEVVAVVATGCREEDEADTTRRLADLQPLWDHVAVALANALLFESAQEEVAERKQAQADLKREYEMRTAEDRIRMAVASMEHPRDLTKVVGAIKAQVAHMGVICDSLSVQIVNAGGTNFVSIGDNLTTQDEQALIRADMWSNVDGNAQAFPWVLDVWRTRKPRLVGRTTLAGIRGGLPVTDLALIDVPFTRGTLAINRRQANTFTHEDTALLQRFANVLSEGFQRFDEITARLQMEEQLIRIERQSAATELAAGISHNLNNVLTSVLLPAELIAMTCDNPTVRREAEHIVAASERARDLVQRLSDAVRPRADETDEAVDLNERILETIELARPRWQDEPHAMGITIQLVTHLGQIRNVRGSKSELSEVVLNLLLNATDAMPDGGVVTITTNHAPENDYVVLCVSDTGTGMDEETRRRVFEPFFTTKVDVGSGLGLSTAHGTVIRSGGSIQVNSEPGQGAKFTIRLPVFDEAKGTGGQDENSQKAVRTGMILLVEDDERVCQALQRFMSGMHKVEVISDGTEALRRFAPGSFDVALIDLGLPAIPGDKVATQLRQQDPALVTVLLTGWVLADGDPRLAAFDLHLQKPILGSDLKATIARAMALHDSRS